MDVLQPFKEFYSFLCSDIDSRVKDWLFISDPVQPSLIIVAYLLFVYYGPKWMENRKPFNIQPVLIVYNFSMVIFCAYIVLENILVFESTLSTFIRLLTMKSWLRTVYTLVQSSDIFQLSIGGWLNGYTLGCQPVDYSWSPKAITMARGVWLFYIAKFIELLDTVFFILRKKNSQVTFLHVFHHGCLPMFWWWGVKAVPGGFGTFHGLVNCCVHVVMYLYYGIAALGPKYQKYIWWKKYVTIFQLTQFFIVTVHNSQYVFRDFSKCGYPWKYVAFIQGFTTIIAILFLQFYIKTYKRSSGVKWTDNRSKANGAVFDNTHSNGTTITNGYQNGNKSKDVRRRR